MRARLLVMSLLTTLLIASCLAFAQQRDEGSGRETVVTPNEASPQLVRPAALTPRHFYRLDFVLRETDEGKPVNQRAYTMNVSADPADNRERTWWNLRAGTRLPVHDPNGTNFVDVGINFDITAKDAENALQLEVTTEISSVPTESGSTPPPIRQMKVKGAVFAPLGKQTMVFTTEDPGSRHQFELQVTPVRTR
jgi:hypothetical protein